MNKRAKLLTLFTLITGGASVVWLILWIPANLAMVMEFAQSYPVLFPLVFIIYRAVSVVIPPLPGGMLSIAMIPVWGWWSTFIYTEIALLGGTSVGFYIARRFREPAVKRFVPLQQLHSWQETISHKTEFFAFLGFRITTAPVFDFISYVAGLSKISYRKFIIATAIAEIPTAIIYYTGEQAYKRSAYLAVVMVAVMGLVYYLAQKKKFFEKRWGDCEKT